MKDEDKRPWCPITSLRCNQAGCAWFVITDFINDTGKCAVHYIAMREE